VLGGVISLLELLSDYQLFTLNISLHKYTERNRSINIIMIINISSNGGSGGGGSTVVVVVVVAVVVLVKLF
jgi:hypothetical protein